MWLLNVMKIRTVFTANVAQMVNAYLVAIVIQIVQQKSCVWMEDVHCLSVNRRRPIAPSERAALKENVSLMFSRIVNPVALKSGNLDQTRINTAFSIL